MKAVSVVAVKWDEFEDEVDGGCLFTVCTDAVNYYAHQLVFVRLFQWLTF